MAMLKSVKKSETEILTIAGLAIAGGIGLYALAKNAGGISDFIGKIFGAFGSNIESNLLGTLSGGGQGSTVPGGGTGDSSTKYATKGSSGGTLPNTQTTGEPSSPTDFIIVKDYANGGDINIHPQALKLAGESLAGKIPNVNLAVNPEVKLAENAIIAGLGQPDLNKLTGQEIVGTFLVPGGTVQPLTQNAVDYYNKIHVGITEITHF